MKAVVLTLLGLLVAATLAQPALAGRTDYIWLDNTVQQTNQPHTSGAGPVIKPEAQTAVDPHGDYFFLADETQQPGVKGTMQGCKCAGCGAGPKAKTEAQPQKADQTKKDKGTARTSSPWNF